MWEAWAGIPGCISSTVAPLTLLCWLIFSSCERVTKLLGKEIGELQWTVTRGAPVRTVSMWALAVFHVSAVWWDYAAGRLAGVSSQGFGLNAWYKCMLTSPWLKTERVCNHTVCVCLGGSLVSVSCVYVTALDLHPSPHHVHASRPVASRPTWLAADFTISRKLLHPVNLIVYWRPVRSSVKNVLLQSNQDNMYCTASEPV